MRLTLASAGAPAQPAARGLRRRTMDPALTRIGHSQPDRTGIDRTAQRPDTAGAGPDRGHQARRRGGGGRRLQDIRWYPGHGGDRADDGVAHPIFEPGPAPGDGTASWPITWVR